MPGDAGEQPGRAGARGKRYWESRGERRALLDPARFRAARTAAGLSQQQLADAVDCHKSFVGLLENGRSLGALAVLAARFERVMGVPAGSLFAVSPLDTAVVERVEAGDPVAKEPADPDQPAGG
jgi:transcriptional regulator with XRE-family HTH domain